jgi:CheY-like chemotaxis protein
MGGRLWAESEPGKGSAFHFTARLGVSSAAPDRSLTAPGARAALPSVTGQNSNLRILVVEDNRVNLKLAQALLKKRGFAATAAMDGKEAVAAYEGGQFDLILMDVQMPEMNGIEATAIIRERERTNGTHVPIIALTAHAMKGDRENCIAHGMDGYISKPLDAGRLFEEIDVVLSRGPNEVTAP